MEKQASALKMVFLICLVGVFVCCVLVYLSPHLYLIKLGYAVERLAMERRQLWEEQQVLVLEAASLRALERVEVWGREQGGMVFLARDQLVYVVRERPASRVGE